MNEARERDDRKDRRSTFFSCAFCHEKSPKPFKICESCGTNQPAEPESEEE